MNYNTKGDSKGTPRIDLRLGIKPAKRTAGVFRERQVWVGDPGRVGPPEIRGYWRRPEWKRGLVHLFDLFDEPVMIPRNAWEGDTMVLQQASAFADDDSLLVASYEAYAGGGLPPRDEQQKRHEALKAAREAEKNATLRLEQMRTLAPEMHALLLRAHQLIPLANHNWHKMTAALIRRINGESEGESS